jgi:hypothetical protein
VNWGDKVDARAEESDGVATGHVYPDRTLELQNMTKRSNRWRHVCLNRLRTIWLPQLRRLTGAQVEMTTWQSGTTATIDLEVRWDGVVRGIDLFWDPDECDAAQPNGGWRPRAFEWQAPDTKLERLLADAGTDCAMRLH